MSGRWSEASPSHHVDIEDETDEHAADQSGRREDQMRKQSFQKTKHER